VSYSLLLMEKTNPFCWAVMPMFTKAIKEFSRQHSVDGQDSCAEQFEIAFGAALPQMLGIAIVSDEAQPGELAGHVVCGVETYLGRQVCMVYQFNKADSDADWKETNKAIQVLVDQWCHTLGLPEIMALAETESRGRLFELFGYVKGPVMMRRKFK